MNIVKFRDIVLTSELAPQLSDSQISFFNDKLKGKYAYCVNWSYVIPLDNMSNEEYVSLSKDLTKEIYYDIEFIIDDTVVNEQHVKLWYMPNSQIVDTHRDPTDIYTYEFVRWEPEIQPAHKNTAYYAVYNEILKEYNVVWKNDDGTILKEEVCTLDKDIVYDGEDPQKAPIIGYTYKFIGWDTEVYDTVNLQIVYVAKYEAIPNVYVITWLSKDGTPIRVDNVNYGSLTPEPPTPPTVEGYDFVGWFPELFDIVDRNMTYQSQYEERIETGTIYKVVKNVSDISEDKRYHLASFNTGSGSESKIELGYTHNSYAEVINSITASLDYMSKEEFNTDKITLPEDVSLDTYNIKLIPTGDTNSFYIFLINEMLYVGMYKSANKICVASDIDVVEDKDDYVWKISIEEVEARDGNEWRTTMLNKNYNTYYIQHNPSHARFTAYKSEQNKVCLFENTNTSNMSTFSLRKTAKIIDVQTHEDLYILNED